MLHFRISSWLEENKPLFGLRSALLFVSSFPELSSQGFPSQSPETEFPINFVKLRKLIVPLKVTKINCEDLKHGIIYTFHMSETFHFVYSVRNIILLEKIEWAQEMENVKFYFTRMSSCVYGKVTPPMCHSIELSHVIHFIILYNLSVWQSPAPQHFPQIPLLLITFLSPILMNNMANWLLAY